MKWRLAREKGVFPGAPEATQWVQKTTDLGSGKINHRRLLRKSNSSPHPTQIVGLSDSLPQGTKVRLLRTRISVRAVK